ncbi:hypothetical protein IV73_GL000408 [Weissella kandleri]|uniref:Uncharacterized protein n=1 Tax=Weissella kandleri TaxID=1616 RepID=A0A0R2JD29_9LACO|nr:hypothetical protein [Weissella kandleri]KRN75250.1 hypothetical protein IV73_GL000408 [Weissella kandleri]
MAISKIFYEYFSGRYSINLKLCDITLNRLNISDATASVYNELKELINRQSETIETTLKVFPKDNQDIITKSYGKDKLTADALAKMYNTTPNHINKVRQKFTQSYKKNGGDVTSHHDILAKLH